MSRIFRTAGFRISVSGAEIARVLGYGQNEMPERVRAVVRDAERKADRIVKTAASYRYLDHDEFSHSKYLSCLDRIVLCLVTIGGDLEEAVQAQKRAGDLALALVLDSYGSAAAEAAADAVEAIIKAEVAEKGLKCSSRFSPGYGGWDVAEQKWILPVLEGEVIGVKLTEGCMMVPRKSITFAVTYGENPVSVRDGEMCEDCEMENCRFRRTGKEAFKPEEQNEA